jgi:hypothetical protein
MITARLFLTLLAAGFLLLAVGTGFGLGVAAGLALGGALMAAWGFVATQVVDE